MTCALAIHMREPCEEQTGIEVLICGKFSLSNVIHVLLHVKMAPLDVLCRLGLFMFVIRLLFQVVK